MEKIDHALCLDTCILAQKHMAEGLRLPAFTARRRSCWALSSASSGPEQVGRFCILKAAARDRLI